MKNTHTHTDTQKHSSLSDKTHHVTLRIVSTQESGCSSLLFLRFVKREDPEETILNTFQVFDARRDEKRVGLGFPSHSRTEITLFVRILLPQNAKRISLSLTRGTKKRKKKEKRK